MKVSAIESTTPLSWNARGVNLSSSRTATARLKAAKPQKITVKFRPLIAPKANPSSVTAPPNSGNHAGRRNNTVAPKCDVSALKSAPSGTATARKRSGASGAERPPSVAAPAAS